MNELITITTGEQGLPVVSARELYESLENKSISCIYCIRSRKYPNRFYVGSATNISKRRSQHLADLSKNRHHSILLQRHANKHGLSDLYFEVIKRCSVIDLIGTEQHYLDQLRPYYNTLLVANSPAGTKRSLTAIKKWRLSMQGYRHSEETIQKIRDSKREISLSTRQKQRLASTGRVMSEGARKKISAAATGRVLSVQTKQKISAANKGKKGKAVLCTTNNTRYTSITEAAQILGLDFRRVSRVCNGSRKRTGGLHFEFIQQ